jgi:serine/threonine protein kinase
MRQAGEQIPGYRFIRQMTEGGMGVLRLACETRTGREVVVKTMRPQIAATERAAQVFLRECSISRSLRHPRIVEFITAGEYDGLLYIVMEYVHGRDADKLRVEMRDRVPERDAVTLAIQTLEALEYAHTLHIVHRDLKPHNLMVSGQSPDYQLKVTDFGVARSFREAGMSGLTRKGEFRGSLGFTPPEQVMDCRKVDHRSDLFSLGATIYNLLCGELIYPFQHGKDPFLTILEDAVVPIKRRGVRVSRNLSRVLRRALQRSADRRYQSAREMRQALQLV